MIETAASEVSILRIEALPFDFSDSSCISKNRRSKRPLEPGEKRAAEPTRGQPLSLVSVNVDNLSERTRAAILLVAARRFVLVSIGRVLLRRPFEANYFDRLLIDSLKILRLKTIETACSYVRPDNLFDRLSASLIQLLERTECLC